MTAAYIPQSNTEEWKRNSVGVCVLWSEGWIVQQHKPTSVL